MLKKTKPKKKTQPDKEEYFTKEEVMSSDDIDDGEKSMLMDVIKTIEAHHGKVVGIKRETKDKI